MDHGPTYAQNPISVRLYCKFHLLYLHIAAVLQCISVNETPHIKIASPCQINHTNISIFCPEIAENPYE